ncbi:hypothetical protein Ade02nite_00160 [Paractinoplanes deccanensis]|uniref:Uncharacterized protein n=1 Tax=Paractinoplanes deccanensis TaxID=113561 RepID=A0ABQ3XUI4_9ACTN|nr:hypothetical protein [Actinoplanes deccanensis]GID71375.1 hypothetical protein Ade02nite_00160 [Actinoplanes deccanensis]
MSDTDHGLHRKVERVESLVLRLEQGVGQVGVQVAHVGQRAEEANDRLQKLSQAFEDYVLKAERTANVQRSETRIGVVEGQIEHQFGHYKVVRRVATGMLQGFDLGLVSDDTLRDVGEQLMIETPRYWLAPVLVALRSWLADDQQQCERAVQEAFRRSPSRTSLFMALMLRRQGRVESSLRWLRHYLAALDPNGLGREFAVILESVSQGAFGPAGVEIVRERLEVWRAQLLGDEGREQAQVDRWRAEIERHAGPSSQQRFPRLAAVCPQWPQMDQALSKAAAHDSLIAKYSAMTAEEPAVRERLEDQVDDILDQLVTGYDEEELPLRRELAQHHAVVRNGGDLDAAQRDLGSDLLALDRRLDYLTIQSESALNPDKLGVTRATQRMAVSACHEWFGRAHATYSRDYRATLPADVEAVVETSHTPAGQAFRLPRWTGSFTRPIEELERSLAEHWDRAARPFIDSFAYKWGRNLIAPIAVVAVLLVCVGVMQNPAMLILPILVGGVWAAVLWWQSQNAAARQKEVEDALQLAKLDSVQQLRGAAAEVVDWSGTFRQADSREPAVRALIADLATAGNAPAPFERRVADARAGA